MGEMIDGGYVSEKQKYKSHDLVMVNGTGHSFIGRVFNVRSHDFREPGTLEKIMRYDYEVDVTHQAKKSWFGRKTTIKAVMPFRRLFSQSVLFPAAQMEDLLPPIKIPRDGRIALQGTLQVEDSRSYSLT